MNYHFQMSRALLKVDNILDRKKIIEKVEAGWEKIEKE